MILTKRVICRVSLPDDQTIPVSKERYIRAKERWAEKMKGTSRQVPRSENRLPPGQREVHDFPVLDLGIRPEIPKEQWSLSIRGKVENPVTLDWDAFMALPQFEDTSDFHCVTTWSQFDMKWSGVAFFTLADLVKPTDAATHVFFKCNDDYSTSVTMDVCMDDDVLVAHSWNGEPLSLEHGGPARAVIPKLYAWKSAKFVREIIFIDRPLLGYWETRGYSQTADPWTDDRFSS